MPEGMRVYSSPLTLLRILDLVHEALQIGDRNRGLPGRGGANPSHGG